MKDLHCERMVANLLVLLACALLSGCAPIVPVNYYQLSALEMARSAPATPETGKMVIGIGPVRLPEYLERSKIVTRVTPNRLQLADSHRWAEPLSENIPRVMGENLSALLGTDRILLYPWPSSRTTDYQLIAEVYYFENESDGAARLVVLWSVKGQDGGIVLSERRSNYRVPATSQDQEGLVVALNEALGSFCREIAQELTPLLAKPSSSKL